MALKAAIVGGGPAGASAALGLIKAGFQVDLYEQREKIGPRVCGAFLNAEALRQLKWLGISPSGAPVTSASLHDDKGRTLQLPMEGLALSRPDLEKNLLDAVQARGGKNHFGEHIKDLANVKADAIVVAGGRFSASPSPALSPLGRGTIFKRLFAPPREGRGKGRGWYGWNASFKNVKQNPGELSLHFFPGGYVGVITFADGTSNVCGLFKRKGNAPINWQKTHEQAHERLPSLKNMLADAEQTTEWHGVGPLPYSTSMREMAGVLLAGDAAAVGDPYMGEGLGRALSAGPMLHQAWTETAKISRRSTKNFGKITTYRACGWAAWRGPFSASLHSFTWRCRWCFDHADRSFGRCRFFMGDFMDRTFHIQNSEKCFRFKPEAFCNHAPQNKGIYELVTFDEKQNPVVLYVGAAFDKGILQCLEAHADGSVKPSSKEIFEKYPNLYFDYIATWDAKSAEDAQDVYWWLIQKHRPPYNDTAAIKNSGRPGNISVIEAE